jgi:hypothetical protein
MQAFVLAVPQAARHLRPICTALQIPIPLYLKQRASAPPPEPETGAPAPDPAPIIRRLTPDPGQAHPGWRNYVTISGQLRA